MPNARESSLSRWAWKLLRLELLSVRRGGAFKLQLRLLVLKFLKTIGHVATPRSHIWYGERELSFEKMPVVHVKMHRPGSMRFMFPCINPKVNFDMEFDDEEGDRAHNGNDSKKKSFFLENGDGEECFYDDDNYGGSNVRKKSGGSTREQTSSSPNSTSKSSCRGGCRTFSTMRCSTKARVK